MGKEEMMEYLFGYSPAAILFSKFGQILSANYTQKKSPFVYEQNLV